MSAISLTASIRTPRVDAGQASTLHSERIALDPERLVNPNRYLYDNYGRGAVAIDSLYALAPGYDPMQRIVVENAVSRPQYGYYLNVPRGMSGIGEDEEVLIPRSYESRELSDTLGVGRYSALGYAPTYKVDGPLKPQFSSLSQEDKETLMEMERQNRIARKVYTSARYAGPY